MVCVFFNGWKTEWYSKSFSCHGRNVKNKYWRISFTIMSLNYQFSFHVYIFLTIHSGLSWFSATHSSTIFPFMPILIFSDQFYFNRQLFHHQSGRTCSTREICCFVHDTIILWIKFLFPFNEKQLSVFPTNKFMEHLCWDHQVSLPLIVCIPIKTKVFGDHQVITTAFLRFFRDPRCCRWGGWFCRGCHGKLQRWRICHVVHDGSNTLKWFDPDSNWT